jgi:hypothetical protein
MRYLLLCLLLVGCALSPDRAKQMSQEDLCYTAADTFDTPTYQSATKELNSRGQDCKRWISYLQDRQKMGRQGQPKDYLRCQLSNGDYVFCSAPSDSSLTLITPIGPTNTAIPPMYMITK